MQRLAPVGGGASFWSGRLASSLANVITTVAIPYLLAIVLALPPATVGLILSVQVSGFVAAPFISGYIVDTKDRLLTMRYAELIRGVALAVMALSAFTGFGVEITVACCSFVVSIAGSVYFAALSASMPDIVGNEMLPRANARLQGISAGTEAAGGIAGSGLLILLGVPLALALNAILFVMSSLGLRRSNWQGGRQARVDGVATSETVGYWRTIIEGFRLLIDEREFRGLIITGALANFVIAGTTLPLLILLVEDLKFPFIMYAVVLGIGSAGALLGAAQFGRISEAIGSPKKAQALALVVYALGFAVYAVLGEFGVGSFIVAACTDFIIGIAISVYVIHNATQQQRAISREKRGRSSSLRAFANSGMSAIGISAAGLLAGAISVAGTIWIAAGALVLISVLALLLLPNPKPHHGTTSSPSDSTRNEGVNK